MRVDVAAITHRGAVRANNEDAAGVAGWVLTGEEPSALSFQLVIESSTDFVVADGLGGHSGGARASHEAVSAYCRTSRDSADLLSAVLAADDAVHEASERDPALRGMGTTLVGARLDPHGVLTVINVGDSRAYRVVGSIMGQLSEDDRMPGARSTLSQVIGGERRVALEPHVFETTFRVGETLLLCSDGLHDVVDEATIASLVSHPLGVAATALVEAALKAGAPDNVTVVLVSIAEVVADG